MEHGDIDNTNGDPSESEEENQEKLASLADALAPADRARVTAATADANAVVNAINAATAQATVQAAQLPRAGANNPRDLAITVRDSQTDHLVEQIGLLRQQVSAIQAQGDGFKTRMLFATCKVLSGLGGAFAIYFGIKRTLGYDHSAMLPLAEVAATAAPPAADPDPINLAATWQGPDEQTYWNGLADFVDANKPRSYMEQLMFMQFTEDLGQYLMNQNWQWNSAQDKVELINAVANSIANPGLAATYRAAPKLTYRGQQLPRAIAANIHALAILKWWSDFG